MRNRQKERDMILESYGDVDAEALDDLVITIAEGIAANINNGGLFEQVGFLLENGVPVRQIIHELENCK